MIPARRIVEPNHPVIIYEKQTGLTSIGKTVISQGSTNFDQK